ncbi:MAG TPA: glycosyltransferase family 4 protein [Actinomycetota bacterium]|jgi:colanic acid biosynthesis glycosyl transferase WcaI|nr:glycosyltransferase family 4 protein [Actinomycetota bacterium]
MRLIAVVPHFEPDVAPTGAVATRIVEELGGRGHRIEVVTSYPWYRDHRIEPGYDGRLYRYEDTPWGRITRVHPFPSADKRNIVRRGLSFAGFSALAAAVAAPGKKADGVLAMSPPLTIGLTGYAIAKARRAKYVFNVQDVYPDVAVEVGVLKSKRVIAAAARLERLCYEMADAVTVLSDDLRDNVAAKTKRPEKVRVIPNFVDTDWIMPSERENAYRKQYGLCGKTVVMYAGNVGFSQSLNLVLEAAASLAHEKNLVFVINGQGSARSDLERRARGLDNVVFVDMQPTERLPEVLAAGDIHLVPLKRGLARSSVPSKTYSILAAGRPLIASVDEASEVARVVDEAGAGLAVPPEDAGALTRAVADLIHDPAKMKEMGAAGRRFVEGWASPAAVAQSYERLFSQLRDG